MIGMVESGHLLLKCNTLNQMHCSTCIHCHLSRVLMSMELTSGLSLLLVVLSSNRLLLQPAVECDGDDEQLPLPSEAAAEGGQQKSGGSAL